MKKETHILRISAALVLLLLSCAVRNYSSSYAYFTTDSLECFDSEDSTSGVLKSLDNASFLNLICEDDTSDDDDHHYACLSSHKKKKARILSREKHFCYLWQSPCTSVFFSSDTSPPIV